MLSRLLAVAAAVAAAAALFFAVMHQNPAKPQKQPKPDEAKVAFADIMKDVRSADTLHAKVTLQDGKSGEFWSDKTGRTRQELGDGRVFLSDGAIDWLVDEKSGKASRSNAGVSGLPVRVMLGRMPVDNVVAAGMVTQDGAEYKVFRGRALIKGDPNAGFEALVDAKTNKLAAVQRKDDSGAIIESLVILAFNADLPEDKFLVLNTLSEDGRVGKVTDTQGIVTAKPLAQERWTPVGTNFVAMPGDWLRTDVRGANAAMVKLISRTGLIVGPGSLVELAKSNLIKLHEGEVEISVPTGSSVELIGPEDQKIVVKGTEHYRVDRNQKLLRVQQPPLWLKGFKGATANESIGSLIAKVDGRDVSLSVGYHHVSVDIRDQIARTTIEESFVNHTPETLEGVFHFPLPADSSISGFGMWIGDQLVMADVVEKQRAREIYEQIKREKRDPGLLEWSGGNIFTARVWPIFAHSEKRIKIVYTQVLPLRGNQYSYSYALQSELLQQHPLRDLSLTVNVNSAVPLKRVSSPTHATRDQLARHSARVEFTAQEYTPRKDFEVTIEQDRRAGDIVMIPLRRGNDGYFMLQVVPPYSGDARAVLPDAGPLHLLVVADTSASMDRRQRQQQEVFIAALLSSLTPKDTFNLSCCDVTCDWVFEHPVPAEGKNVVAARQMLDRRVSLGWTDLDKAFGSAILQSSEQTHVVYVGDGIPTTHDADAVAFAKRLKGMYDGKAGTFHAVSTGSSYEAGVLKAVGSLGGGSVRKIGSEQGPSAVALELMREIAQPTLRDVKVEFTGLRTARVYPEQLANVPAGTQQILLGRYLPEDKDQSGEVTVSGMMNGKPVRMSAKVELKGAGAEESFIPRLWARMHLDVLLEQGTSEAIKDEIIALSEEYNIITPYTSFLVLESDADRERFGVKKRFRMRDGEKFFAAGRDNVAFELVQQQMKRAGLYRQNLRRDVLRDLAALGRNLQQFQSRRQLEIYSHASLVFDALDDSTTYMLGMQANEPWGASMGTSRPGGMGGFGGGFPEEAAPEEFGFGRSGGLRDKLSRFSGGLGDREEGFDEIEKSAEMADRKADKAELLAEGKDIADQMAMEFPAGEAAAVSGLKPMNGPYGGRGPSSGLDFDGDTRALRHLESELSLNGRLMKRPYSGDGLDMGRAGDGYFRDGGRYVNESLQWQRQWWELLFPMLPAAAKARPEFQPTWPAAAREISRRVLKIEALKQIKGGLEFSRQTDQFDPRWNELTQRHRMLELISAKAWLTRVQPDGSATTVTWCDGKEYASFNKAFQLGRTRPAVALDLDHTPSVEDYSFSALEQAFSAYTPTIEHLESEKDRIRLVLKSPKDTHEVRILIDPTRNVILLTETLAGGKLQSTQKFSEFVQVAGAWWPGKIETLGDKGERQAQVTFTVKELSADEFSKRQVAELTGRGDIQFFAQPLPKVTDAKKAVAAGTAKIEDHVTLLRHFAAIQQWTKVREQLDAIEKMSKQPGLRFLHDAVLHLSRRFDELRQRFLAEGERVAKSNLAENDAYALVNYLMVRGPQFLQAAEVLTLLDRLEPVYRRQPAHRHGMKEWTQARIAYLPGAGRMDEARELAKKLATDYPRDASLQQQYAQMLFNAGDFAAGYAWITQALAKNDKWLDHEEENLRGVYAQQLQGQGRHADLLAYVDDWAKRNPRSVTPYAMKLGTLVRLDQEDKANALLAQWLREGQVKGEIPPAVAARLQAAINQALGQVYNLYTNRIEERWHAPLGQVVRFFARDEKNGGYADSIIQHYQFTQTDENRKLRIEFAHVLAAEVRTLPLGRLERILSWVNVNDPAVEAAEWDRLKAGLHQRWEAEKEPHVRHALANVFTQFLRNRGLTDELLAFLRQQLKDGDKEFRPSFANQLFNTLLEQNWKAEYETEAIGLLGKLSDAPEAADREFAMAAALLRFTDRMVAARNDDLNKKIDRPDKLTRNELRDKHAANLKVAREGVADRLGKAVAEVPKELAPWVKIEKIYLDTVLERDGAQIAADCWEMIGSEPPRPVDPDAETPVNQLEAVRKDRAFTTLCYLTTRPKADPALIDKLLKFVDAAIAREGEGATWKGVKYRLLVGLDRPKELEQDLRKWAAGGPEANHWRLTLGYLTAETGHLSEAVELFERVEAADELGPKAYRSLADWYMVLNRRQEHEQALLNSYKTMEEYRLAQLVQVRLYPWQRGGTHLPSELDPEVLRVFKVLFDKSAQPQNYLYLVQQFYQACRDFRLLGMLADAVVGQTPGKVYPFLQGMGSVLSQIQDEAVVDEMMERLNSARKTAKTPVDQRALDLLEVLTRRRAAELKNQPGPHGDRALEAMKRAFDREWVEGEQRLMAELLFSLGHIAYEPMAQEQVRELDWLYRQQKKSTFDRLHVGQRYASVIDNYGRHGEAMDVLQTELQDFQAAHRGVLPTDANDAVVTFVNFTLGVMHHTRGEKFLLEQLKLPVHEQQKLWLVERLNQLYQNALAAGGEVSLGKGDALYKALEQKLRRDLAGPDQNHQYQTIALLLQVYRTARDKGVAGYQADLKSFADKLLPEALKFQANNYDTILQQVAQTEHDLLGPEAAIGFVLDRIDSEPAWMRLSQQDGWSRHGYLLAQWRTEAKALGDLEPRLLKLVLSELRKDLESRQQRNRVMYWNGYNYFWSEKAADFAKTAEEVYARHKESGASVKYIADYFYNGLSNSGRAIEMLFAAHEKKLLDEGGISQLVQYLRNTNRHQEAVALLEPLVNQHAGNLQYRVWLMNSYHHTRQPQKVLALLKDTEAYFHKDDRWSEGVAGQLGYSTLENDLWPQSVEYYNEAIQLRQRASANRGVGDGVLAEYYSQQAQGYSRLGKTAEAVDAASGAIVAWPANHTSRTAYLERLKQVLTQAGDLDAYVAQLDAKEKQEGQGSPVVRKAVAGAYFARNQFDKALVQYRAAAELQPEDAETHAQLVACYDKLGDKAGAARQILESVQLSRRNVKLYEDLGNRYQAMSDFKDAERAYTSIVEMQASEADARQLMAEIRQKQERWEEAAEQWEQAAKLRALEPTGLIGLAKAQLHLKQYDKAHETIQKLERHAWPARFDAVKPEIHQLRAALLQQRKR
ncbi:MAG: VIT domain-containing protein [Gemmataceae bacterium]